MSSFQRPRNVPHRILVDEETLPAYPHDLYYPARPGEVLGDRYKVLFKIGFDDAWTSWIAEDLDPRRSSKHVTVKIMNADHSVEHECDIGQRLKHLRYVTSPYDSFRAEGPTGTKHLCIVFAGVGESLSEYRGRHRDAPLPIELFKTIIDDILKGLESIHSKKIIHTDLNADNITIRFSPLSIEQYVNRMQRLDYGTPCQKRGDRSPIYCSLDLECMECESGVGVWPEIADFSRAQQEDGDRPFRYSREPLTYRAPEVILGLTSSFSADIWSLGVMLLQLFADEEEDLDVFNIAKSRYSARLQRTAPRPSKLSDEETQWDIPWEESPSPNFYREFYNGSIVDPGLDDCFRWMERKERKLFLNFVRKMLQWLPQNRKSAKELREDPWLKTPVFDLFRRLDETEGSVAAFEELRDKVEAKLDIIRYRQENAPKRRRVS